jgi:hypothetical protein
MYEGQEGVTKVETNGFIEYTLGEKYFEGKAEFTPDTPIYTTDFKILQFIDNTLKTLPTTLLFAPYLRTSSSGTIATYDTSLIKTPALTVKQLAKLEKAQTQFYAEVKPAGEFSKIKVISKTNIGGKNFVILEKQLAITKDLGGTIGKVDLGATRGAIIRNVPKKIAPVGDIISGRITPTQSAYVGKQAGEAIKVEKMLVGDPRKGLLNLEIMKVTKPYGKGIVSTRITKQFQGGTTKTNIAGAIKESQTRGNFQRNKV